MKCCVIVHRHSAHTQSPPPESPASLRHTPLEESSASVSLLSAVAASAPGQDDSFQPPPAVCSSSLRPQAPSSPPRSSTPSPPLLTCNPSLLPPNHASSPAQAHSPVIRELQWPGKKRQLFPRTRVKEAHEPCSVWVSTAAGEVGGFGELGEGQR